MGDSSLPRIEVATAVRTLIASGFQISDARRQPQHIEILCARQDIFDVEIKYLLAIFDSDEPSDAALQNATTSSERLGRTFVAVSGIGSDHCMSWMEFVESLGGPVPSWRALSPEYSSILLTASTNHLPEGLRGEPWQVFEDIIADGLEFLLGNRVLRQGGRKRGKRVSDMLALTPDYRVLVVDAKASEAPFDLTWPALRPLIEYTGNQVTRQRPEWPVGAAVVVAADFRQDDVTLAGTSNEFLSETRVPLSFLRATVLANAVAGLAAVPRLRGAVKWARIFCRSGVITWDSIETEISTAKSQQYPR